MKGLCKCGCGNIVSTKRDYIYGHKKYGSDYIFPEAKRELMSAARKGIPVWPNGRVFTEEHLKNLSLAKLGKPKSKEWCKAHSKLMSGRTYSDTHCNNISLGLQGETPHDGYGYLFRKDKEYREEIVKNNCEVCGTSVKEGNVNRHHKDLDKTTTTLIIYRHFVYHAT